MRRVWLIRAGQNGEQIDSMRHAGQIGLPFDRLGDPRQLDDADLERALTGAGHVGGAAASRALVRSFVDGVRMGDLIVSPNDARHEVWLATVSGDYRFATDPATGLARHTRAVDWLGWLDRDAAFMRDQWKSIDRPLPLYELFNRDWWWKHVGSAAIASVPRAAWSKPVKAASTRTRSTTSTPRVPKPAPKPKPKAAAPVLCAGSCGLVWSPYVLVDGLCADCRNE